MSSSELTKDREIEQNPFIYNAPVRGNDFYNRDEIITRLLKETASGISQGDVWLTGERQVGKTSLLRYIQSKYEKQSHKFRLYNTDEYVNLAFIYLNTQDNQSPADFYRNLRQSLKNYFDFKIENPDNPFESFIYAAKYLFFERKYYIIFLVDEFDALVENIASDSPKSATSFLGEINRLMHGVAGLKNEPKLFGFIFAANHSIEDLMTENDLKRRGSGFMLESMILPWFTKEQVDELAYCYLQDHPLQFSEKETDFCFKMTQGYPYFVQKLFSIMYRHKLNDSDPNVYLSKVKKDYGKSFQETVNGWGGPNLPKRTLEKLKELSGKMVRNIGDRSLSILFKGIEEYLKMQLKS